MSVSATVTTSRSLLSEGNAAALAALRDALGSGATLTDPGLHPIAPPCKPWASLWLHLLRLIITNHYAA